MTVTFRDINDAKSVQIVDPNNLGAAFGQGYGIVNVTLEITKAPVTVPAIKPILK
ncbi:hypothetical protein [Pseudorhodobacter sp.]|uniref:hypothetical protein n=1 Tax=Pseudorhodobacter sp. TaxID=1934400 RepID=UPI0026489E07|nr:hypothetical protein [Pseudorhodobacter sp.]MDN5786428.1 hypothetical protein [Pseudorhodobacter sp.]